jgi:hypothetical protein
MEKEGRNLERKRRKKRCKGLGAWIARETGRDQSLGSRDGGEDEGVHPRLAHQESRRAMQSSARSPQESRCSPCPHIGLQKGVPFGVTGNIPTRFLTVSRAHYRHTKLQVSALAVCIFARQRASSREDCAPLFSLPVSPSYFFHVVRVG